MQHADIDSAEKHLPDLDGLVATTVALMTSWADPCSGALDDAAMQRSLLARKVVSTLFFLQHHPCATAALREAVSQAHQRWVGIARVPVAAALDAGPRSDCEPLH